MKDNKHFNIENFDYKIDEWHNSDSELPLHEYEMFVNVGKVVINFKTI